MERTIITEIKTKQQFIDLLQANTGVFIIKFGAEWCGPCKQIERHVNELISKMPANVMCAIIDIDECFEMYAFMKKNKMVKSIPTLLAYNKGNVTYIPDDNTIGSDLNQLYAFFKRCENAANNISV